MNYTHADLNDTIVALSTPPGIGALGVVRLSGTTAISICNAVFKGKNLKKQKSHTIHYGTIRSGKQIIDEVLVSIFRNPRSYTREDMVEISCHGSPYILQQVIAVLLENGARLAKAGEFTLRAFLNGRLDLSQAEAVADLIASQSASAHEMAMRQMRGGFSKQIAQLREQLIHFASLIELELDFGEEDVAFANRDELHALVQQIQQLVGELRDSFLLGNALKHGVTTVIAGRPNAGKSTLLNALLNEERAIVSEIAGTTRDTIEELVTIKGIQFRFIDTAGIRAASDAIEAIGVQRTYEKIANSAILLYVFDKWQLSVEALKQDIEKLAHDQLHIIVVANKDDAKMERQVIGTEKNDYWTAISKKYNLLHISAKEKRGIHDLKELLYDAVMVHKPQSSNTIVSNARHFEALNKTQTALDDVLKGLAMQISGELLALDIRIALEQLGTITGQVTNEDLLGNIFANFCIGK